MAAGEDEQTDKRTQVASEEAHGTGLDIERVLTKTKEPVANSAAQKAQPSLGRIMVDAGLIKESDIESILEYANQNDDLFGAAAVKLRMVNTEDLAMALAKQFKHTHVRDGKSGLKKELIALFNPRSAKVEALRALRMQLMVDSLNRSNNALAVVSPSSGDGRTFLAANLAVLFAQLGERTVLLDAHMQKPRLHEIFDIDNSQGLSAVLAGRSGGKVALPVPQLENLWVIPAGASPPNPDELLARSSFVKLCEGLMAHYDIVLVDTAPANSSTGFVSAANSCRKAILVARRDRTRLADVRTLAGRLGTRVDVVGSVLNRH